MFKKCPFEFPASQPSINPHLEAIVYRTNVLTISRRLLSPSLCQGAYIAQLHPGALEYSHITPPAHDAQQPPSISRHRSAPAPARPPVHRRGP